MNTSLKLGNISDPNSKIPCKCGCRQLTLKYHIHGNKLHLRKGFIKGHNNRIEVSKDSEKKIIVFCKKFKINSSTMYTKERSKKKLMRKIPSYSFLRRNYKKLTPFKLFGSYNGRRGWVDYETILTYLIKNKIKSQNQWSIHWVTRKRPENFPSHLRAHYGSDLFKNR